MAEDLTNQELFWKGKFGNSYIERNKSDIFLKSNQSLFNTIFSKMNSIKTVFEIGANIGMNLAAINLVNQDLKISAIEINEKAFKELRKLEFVNSINGSILDYSESEKFDFVFTKGVLIHLPPDSLKSVYEKIYNISNNYICFIEYYNPTPVSIPYRGHDDKLFKRDFAGEIMDTYSNLELVDYGFVYHRDVLFPQDDMTWFLMKKKND